LSEEERKPKTKAVKDDKKDNNEQYDGDWIEVGAKKGSMTKIKVTAAPLPNDNTYILLSDSHGPRKAETTQQPSNIEASNNTTPSIEQTYTISERSLNKKERQDQKLKRRMHCRQTLQRLAQQDNYFLEESITLAEDERTATAKADTTEVRQNTINKSRNQSKAKPAASITQLAQNTTYGICRAFKRAAAQLLTNKKQVTFGETNNNNKVECAHTVHLTYDSGANRNYVSKEDRKEACMPILRSSKHQ